LEGEVADDGEADTFVCAGYGGDAGVGHGKGGGLWGGENETWENERDMVGG